MGDFRGTDDESDADNTELDDFDDQELKLAKGMKNKPIKEWPTYKNDFANIGLRRTKRILANGTKYEFKLIGILSDVAIFNTNKINTCLLYTSPSPRDATLSRMPSSA